MTGAGRSAARRSGSETRARPAYLIARCTAEDKAVALANAHAAGLTLGAYIRLRVLGKPCEAADSADQDAAG